MEKLENLKGKLIELREEAFEEIKELPMERDEDFQVMDWAGGNIDDAFDMGSDHGEVHGEYETLGRVIKLIDKIIQQGEQ